MQDFTMSKVFTFIFCCFILTVSAQNVGINPSGLSPDPSAGLDVNFTDKGTLITRMTTTQRDAIPANCSCTPVDGLMIFNTTDNCMQMYVQGIWYSIGCANCGDAATISSHPVNDTINEGNNVNFSITASGSGTLTYQWQESTDGGSTWNNITNGGINPTYANATTSTLSLTSVPVGYDSYQYRCIVTGTCPPAANSNSATLKIFQPPCVSDLYAWFDASDVTSITKDGSNRVSQWNNKEGTAARNLVQSTGGTQPLWVAADRNGKDVIDFSSSRLMATSSALPAIPQPITAFMVTVMALNDGSPHTCLDAYGTSNRIIFLGVSDPTGILMMASSAVNLTGPGSGYGAWQYVTTVANTTSSEMRVGGVQQLSGTIGNDSYAGIVVGSNRVSPSVSVWWEQKIAEVIIYDRLLTSAEITEVENYLSNKWGL